METSKEETDNSKEIIEKRKETIISFVKQKKDWIYFILLGLIVWLAVYIRTRNLPGLKDITTGDWTLGPDLDPFLFLRWAKYIAENGTLMAWDSMRYAPLGYGTAGELRLLPYLMAWFYQAFSIFSKDVSVTYASVIFPVFMFALTVVAIFFLVRKIFYDSFENRVYPNAIALIASLFLSVLSPLLPRTIAGIPEKESAAFLFFFLAFYFFVGAWKGRGKMQIINAVLAGMSTATMALIWGGYGYIFLIIGLSGMVSLILGQIDLNKLKVYSIWLFSSFALMIPFSTRYSVGAFLSSEMTLSAIVVLLIGLVYVGIKNTKVKKYFDRGYFSKIPLEISAILITLLGAVVLASLVFGFDFVPGKIDSIYHNLVRPATSRLIQTVAENRQPDFKEWSRSFGPVINGIPLFFWLFFVGSIILFSNMIKKLKLKERVYLVGAYTIFLVALIFSRYSSESIFNGESWQSLFVYFGGMLLFAFGMVFIYLNIHKNKEMERLKSIDFGLVLLISFFVLGIVSARGSVRLIMMLVPVVSIIVAYMIVYFSALSIRKAKSKGDNLFLFGITAIILLLSAYSAYGLYKESVTQASYFVPSQYTYQWQISMAWVRDNVPEEAVFGHWWDYGYWVQSIGERATVLDGGNAIAYWNHMMGRYVLTNPTDKEALEFLYAHNTTHYLIDSTEIGKYSAYSKIGSDADFDRMSFIPTFGMDPQSTRETNDGIIYTYGLGIMLDEDIIWDVNGTQQFFAKENSVVAGIRVKVDKNGEIVYANMIVARPGLQVEIPMRYVYYNGEKAEFEGYDAGIFLMDSLAYDGTNVRISERGVGFYFSPRTVDSFMVRKYLLEEEGNFKLVHKGHHPIMNSLRVNGITNSDFVYFNSQFLGPIKIWEINYPADIVFDERYIETDYPAELL